MKRIIRLKSISTSKKNLWSKIKAIKLIKIIQSQWIYATILQMHQMPAKILLMSTLVSYWTFFCAVGSKNFTRIIFHSQSRPQAFYLINLIKVLFIMILVFWEILSQFKINQSTYYIFYEIQSLDYQLWNNPNIILIFCFFMNN